MTITCEHVPETREADRRDPRPIPPRWAEVIDRCPLCKKMTPPYGPVGASKGIVILHYRCMNLSRHRTGEMSLWRTTWPKPELRRSRITIREIRAREEAQYRVHPENRPHLDAKGKPRTPYYSAASADAASIEKARKTGRPSPRVYLCATCGKWHLSR